MHSQLPLNFERFIRHLSSRLEKFKCLCQLLQFGEQTSACLSYQLNYHEIRNLHPQSFLLQFIVLFKKLSFIKLYIIGFYYILIQWIGLFYTTLYYICSVMLCCIASLFCCTVLHCIVLCCVMLHCVAMSCIVLLSI